MNAVEAVTESTPVRVLPSRALLCLVLQTLGYSVLSLWALDLLPIPGAAWLGPISLSLAYSVAGVIGAAAFAPWFVEETDSPRPITSLVFTVFYQAIVLVFFLRLAGRLSPQRPEASLEAGAWMFQIALLLCAIARLWPRAFSGVAFAWIVAVPVFAYMLAELTLIGTGGVSWQDQARSDTAQNTVMVVRALQQFSPVPALIGALNGNLPDGSPGLFAWPMLGFGMTNTILLFLIRRRTARVKKTA